MISILYHANCVDGWFAAYLTQQHYALQGSPTQSFPITPGQPATLPPLDALRHTEIVLVDVSVPESVRTMWKEEADVTHITCYDHHDAAREDWPADQCPIDSSACTTLFLARLFSDPDTIPSWVYAIDRMDRWDHPSMDDRALREQFLRIAHLCQSDPTEATRITSDFMHHYDDPVWYDAYLAEGHRMLQQKHAALYPILDQGILYYIGHNLLRLWKLPREWLNRCVYVLDTTDHAVDSTDAAQVCFQHLPFVDVFLTLRRKIVRRFDHALQTHTPQTLLVYSARSTSLCLTSHSLFKGHPTAAGAHLWLQPRRTLPFVSDMSVRALHQLGPLYSLPYAQLITSST
jgi:hypothetical protein